MAGISVSGVGSGLDINGLVSQLVTAERAPATNRLNRREASLQAELSAVGTFKGALSELQSAVKGLTDPAKFEAMKATAGDGDLFTATAASAAQAGSYRLEVTQLAEAQKLATPASSAFTSATAVFGSGTITFRFGSYDGGGFTPNADKIPQTVTVDPANNTLQGVRDAINKANVGVTANIVNDGHGYRLTLSAKDTGAKNALEITVNDSDGNNTDSAGLSLLAYDGSTKHLEQTKAAQDAKAVVDGLTVTSTSNTLSEAIEGVTLTLKSAKPGTTTELTVARDTAAVTGAVNAFVGAYNKFANTTAALTAYNPQTKEKGPLLGDAGVRSATSQLRHALGEPVTGNPLRSLSDVGISIQRDGTLKLDSGALQKALEKDPKAVAALFTGAEGSAAPTGIAKRLDDFLGKLVGSGGPLASRTTSLTKRISALDDERADLDRRLADVETRYRAQFTAMDKLVSQLTATGNALTQQLAGLSKNTQS